MIGAYMSDSRCTTDAIDGTRGHINAMAATAYGGPEVLALLDLPDPKVGPDSVLVRTKPAGVNPVEVIVAVA